MTDTTDTTLARPAPRSTVEWRIPKIVRIEGDGFNPRDTKLFDHDTGEELTLPVASLRFEVDADMPNRMEITVANVALRATVHHVHYGISEEDLAMLARQNGFRIEKVPAYPARMRSYGPAEIQITFRDFPDLVVTHRSKNRLEAIEQAEAELHAHLREKHETVVGFPSASEPEEGEFLIWAHEAVPEFAEVD